MIKNCRVLVTGGAGFIGSNIAAKLVEGNELVIFDIFSTGRQENVEQFKDQDNVEILKVDIRDLSAVTANMAGVDYIFHNAALVSVPLSIDQPVAANEHNIIGTLNILEAARKHDVRKVILSSSAAVYGEEPTLPKVETMPTLPKSPYAVSKIASEDYLKVYFESYGLPTVSLRYFNVFGPSQDPNSQYAAVIPNFFSRVIAGQRPVIYGDGEQTRDFIYVADVVDANITAAQAERANGEVFNIAGGTGTSLNELVKLVIGLSGHPELTPEYQAERKGDIKYSYADVSKANDVLGWTPKVSIADGLKMTYEYFKNYFLKNN